jgi:glycosyltransferase involved in cell wall biosynthesis
MRSITCVIPTHNDATRIVATLEHAWASLLVRDIFVLDSASTDGTPTLVADFRAKHSACVHLLAHGSQLPRDVLARRGFELALVAGTDRIVQMSADVAAPIDLLWRMNSSLDDGTQLAIASPYCSSNSAPTSLLRLETLEYVASSFASMMWDASLVGDLLTDGFGRISPQVELVTAALRSGAPVRELPLRDEPADSAGKRLAELHNREGLTVWQSRHAAEHSVLG